MVRRQFGTDRGTHLPGAISKAAMVVLTHGAASRMVGARMTGIAATLETTGTARGIGVTRVGSEIETGTEIGTGTETETEVAEGTTDAITSGSRQ